MKVFVSLQKNLINGKQKKINNIYGCGGVGQPRWFWEPEHAVMAGVSSSLTIHTNLGPSLYFLTNETIYNKKKIMDSLLKCKSFSEMGRILGYAYYNGHVKKCVIKHCNSLGLNPNEIINNNKKEPNKCLFCGKELKGKSRFTKKFCNSSCAASYNNKLRGPVSEETKQKTSESLKKYNALVKKDKAPLKHRIPQDHICQTCGKTFKSKLTNVKFCSPKCAGSNQEIKEKLRKKVQERIENGTFSGWKSRNIISYPEQFWMGVLLNNNIEYKHNFPFGGYFLDFYIEINDRKIDLEIDGKQHEYSDRKEKDNERDIFITSENIEV